ncbi:MAG: NAD(P)H-dependent oxidoreductase [Candidatus Methanoplasma sp.]|jgi:chromate reductase|nr:NAD(P)H-dependent oxidoreductase [Candidatus Methanoplasma sp.]
MKIIAIVGSLRRMSYNHALAEKAGEIIGDRSEFEILDYSGVPFFNEDSEFPAPDTVADIRGKIASADGVWFFSPEYNHTIPGVLKNLIDWLSRKASAETPQVLGGKKAAISGVSGGMSGTSIMQDDLIAVLSYLDMKIMNVPRLTIPDAWNQTDEHGRFVPVKSLTYLEKQTEAFLKFVAEE